MGQPDADLDSVVALLNGLRDLPGGIAARKRPVAWTMGFGLYQGDRIGDLAVRAYRNGLRDVLLPRIAQQLEAGITGARTSQELQRALNSYLMLYYDQLFEPKALEQAATDVIDVALARAGKATLRDDLRGHLKASLELRPIEMIRPRNDELIAAARRRISSAASAS